MGMRHRPRAFYLTVSLSAAAELLQSELVRISKRAIQPGLELLEQESMSILPQAAAGGPILPRRVFCCPRLDPAAQPFSLHFSSYLCLICFHSFCM